MFPVPPGIILICGYPFARNCRRGGGGADTICAQRLLYGDEGAQFDGQTIRIKTGPARVHTWLPDEWRSWMLAMCNV